MSSNRNDTGLNGKRKSSADAKDPSRPRRKKARRACSACQKSHQTCGNERPCQSCVKRGMADSCHDGIRKKPKYLEDGSYRVFTIQYTPPYSNIQLAQPIELPPSGDIAAQSSVTLPITMPDPGFYTCPEFSPWNICAEDPFIGQDLTGGQLGMEDAFYMDSPQSDISDVSTDTLLAFAIGSGWSSTFLQSEYDGGPV